MIGTGARVVRYEQDTLRRLQLVELEVLRAVDAVCCEHGIPYFLDSGSALGAVRHGGFIPWDDDVDVGMLRPDYERFLEVAPGALGEGYVVSDPRCRPEQAGMFAKVWKRGTRFFTEETIEAGIDQGIFVDVFPYDPLHADSIIARRQQRWCCLWQSVSYLYHSRHITVPHQGALGALERGACALAHVAVRACASPDRIREAFESWALRGSDEPGDACATMAYPGTSFLCETLLPARGILFEGSVFPVPAQVEEYLTALYGSGWRELPPVDCRRNHAPVELDFGG